MEGVFEETDGRDPGEVRRENLARAYAAEVRNADRALERLWTALDRLGRLEDTLVVVTSDHGDAFGEHGSFGHGKDLYDEVLRVPLLFWAPDLVPGDRTLDGQVSLVDVAPSVLELLDLTPPLGLQGRSLVHAMKGDPLRGYGVRFAEGQAGETRLIAARTVDRKWIWREGSNDLEMYDLRADPDERSPMDDAALLAEGRALLEAYRGLDRESVQGDRTLDGATRRKLEALGYVE